MAAIKLGALSNICLTVLGAVRKHPGIEPIRYKGSRIDNATNQIT